MSQKYAFIDRDGTLIFEPQDTFVVNGVDQLKVLEGVIPSLKEIIDEGFRLVMVTNQDGLGTSENPKDNFDLIQNTLIKTFDDNGIIFDEIFVCPHYLSENCNCRKPKTGLLDEFLKTTEVDFQNSIMIGDRDTDRQFAENLGVKFLSMKPNGIFPTLTNDI